MGRAIANVTCENLRVPYRYPIIEKQQHLTVTLVQVETDDGITGCSLASFPMRRGIRDFLAHEVAPLVAGMDALRPEQIRATVHHNLSSKYYTGVFSCAMSLLDVALWDIRGKVADQPIWKLLGGGRERAPVYATFGVPAFDDEQLVEAARLMVQQGHNRLKMAIAAGTDPVEGLYGQPSDADLRRDVARVASVREAVGDDVELMIDANKNITYAQALWLARKVEPFDIAWFEDPLPQGDPRLLAQLRQQTSIPIAAGSTGTSDLMHFREYLLLGSVDIIQPNVRDIGGISGALKAAALAQAFNVTMAMGGNWPHLNLPLHGGVANGGLVEFSARASQIMEALFDGVPAPTGAWIDMPTGPGMGYTLKEGAADAFEKVA